VTHNSRGGYSNFCGKDVLHRQGLKAGRGRVRSKVGVGRGGIMLLEIVLSLCVNITLTGLSVRDKLTNISPSLI